MAFNLKKVLKALLFSSSQPLAIKDIQAAFTRFHEQAAASAAAEAATEGSATPAGGENAAPAAPVAVPEPAAEAAEVFAEPEDAELYQEVPSLITATQVREVMDELAAEIKANDDGLLLIEGSSGYRLVTHPRVARWVRILRQEPPPLKLSASSVETLAIVAYRQPVTRGEIETIRGVSAEAGINKLLERDLIYIVGRADLPGRPIQYGTTDHFLEFVGIKSLDELPASDVLSSRQIDSWLKNAMSPAHSPTDTDMGLSDEQIPLETPVATATAEAPAAEADAPATETTGAEQTAAPQTETTDDTPKPTS